MPVLRLALPTPLRREFDYLAPAAMGAAEISALQAGVRLRVPFGSREITGFLLGVCQDSELPQSSLKPALQLLDDAPLLQTSLLQLCQWAADYYHHPTGEVLSAVFPKRLREGKPHQTLDSRAWRLTTRGKGLPEGALARSPRQSEALTLLQKLDTVPDQLFAEQGIKPAILRSLEDKALIESCRQRAPRNPAQSGPGLALNPEQAAALKAMRHKPEGFTVHLLEGVTGSGKTEIYLQLITDSLAREQQVLVLIPEIGLTPQTLARFRERFAAHIVVFHSGLSDGSRYQAWEAARDGTADIVIGTRSAVFTPLQRPGLIIVDEEHDNSFKQQDGFRYSARDVAVKRGQIERCPVVLGSATPSLESIYNAVLGRYQHHWLTRRAGGSSLPAIEAVDVRRQPLEAGLSAQLIDAVEQTLLLDQQVLLFLNRRGHAPTLQCHDCGWLAECSACDARLTVHRRARRLRCHHCGRSQTLPPRCPQCRSATLLAVGLGTQQTEDFLHKRFGNWPIFRVDSDSMQGRNAMQALVQEINKGAPGILLGTQMLTKGHHFPGVSLVAIIDADALLFSADFRGEERMAQLLTQVAGRAGRARVKGRVILQTHYPDHPLLQGMLTTSYAQQARALLARRQATGMPPAGQLVMLRTDCADASCAETFLQELRTRTEQQLPPGSSLIGPLPSPMPRRAGKFRSQLMLVAPHRRAAQEAADLLVDTADGLPARKGLKWSIDIDPQDLF